MSWDDVTYPEPREPEDSWRGGAGEEPDDLDRRPYRVDPQRPHPADCACSVHGGPRPLSWWARRGPEEPGYINAQASMCMDGFPAAPPRTHVCTAASGHAGDCEWTSLDRVVFEDEQTKGRT